MADEENFNFDENNESLSRDQANANLFFTHKSGDQIEEENEANQKINGEQ